MAISAAVCGIAGSAAAQGVVVDEEAVSVTEFTCDNTNRYYSDWRDNWFIQIGAGINQPMVERGIGVSSPGHNVDRHRMTATYNFGFGHWFSPYLAFRVNALGGALHWDCPTVEQPTNGWSRAKHVNVNFDLMWDMLNSICGPDADRVFSIVPYVGVGGDVMWDYRDAFGNRPAAESAGLHRKNNWTLPVSAGVQFKLRLCKYVDFFAEMRANFYGDNWNLVANAEPIEANVSCYGGFSFNIGGRQFGKYNECDYMAQVASLNNEVNNLRAEVLNSAQVIAGLESQLPCPKVEAPKNTDGAPLLSTVRFTIDSDVITPEEEVNVYNMAEYLKANPGKKVTVLGYADKDTGTSEYNLELSKRRAEKVADQLVNKYGISKDRISVKYDGSNVQPYDVNDWNRIVIFTQD